MNIYQIVGSFVIVIGTLISVYGNYINGEKTKKYRGNVSSFIAKQDSLEVPVIDVLSIHGEPNNIKLKIKNTGRQKANKVTFHFTENCSPKELQMNPVYTIKEIPPGTEYFVGVTLFEVFNFLPPETEETMRTHPKYAEHIQGYKNGNMALRVNFYFTYEFDNVIYETDRYTFMYSKDKFWGISKDDD